MIAKMEKKRTQKKMKAKVWKEWHKDFLSENDADQISMLATSLAKLR